MLYTVRSAGHHRIHRVLGGTMPAAAQELDLHTLTTHRITVTKGLALGKPLKVRVQHRLYQHWRSSCHSTLSTLQASPAPKGPINKSLSSQGPATGRPRPYHRSSDGPKLPPQFRCDSAVTRILQSRCPPQTTINRAGVPHSPRHTIFHRPGLPPGAPRLHQATQLRALALLCGPSRPGCPPPALLPLCRGWRVRSVQSGLNSSPQMIPRWDLTHSGSSDQAQRSAAVSPVRDRRCHVRVRRTPQALPLGSIAAISSVSHTPTSNPKPPPTVLLGLRGPGVAG
ncbi:hypothetical protein NDU88_006802 [Pleurodeles waltl]|uniref:Uncharacterized protein n=1 Tax=Pleurodeles waltl TaxID=8319 RepID=A0AAV7UMJ4_PLEWA|nr:hypothetical protein NDU88_006802 [Pleurodeles waltl]